MNVLQSTITCLTQINTIIKCQIFVLDDNHWDTSFSDSSHSFLVSYDVYICSKLSIFNIFYFKYYNI